MAKTQEHSSIFLSEQQHDGPLAPELSHAWGMYQVLQVVICTDHVCNIKFLRLTIWCSFLHAVKSVLPFFHLLPRPIVSYRKYLFFSSYNNVWMSAGVEHPQYHNTSGMTSQCHTPTTAQHTTSHPVKHRAVVNVTQKDEEGRVSSVDLMHIEGDTNSASTLNNNSQGSDHLEAICVTHCIFLHGVISYFT